MPARAKPAVIVANTIEALTTDVNKVIDAKMQRHAGERADLVQLAISMHLAPLYDFFFSFVHRGQ